MGWKGLRVSLHRSDENRLDLSEAFVSITRKGDWCGFLPSDCTDSQVNFRATAVKFSHHTCQWDYHSGEYFTAPKHKQGAALNLWFILFQSYTHRCRFHFYGVREGLELLKSHFSLLLAQKAWLNTIKKWTFANTNWKTKSIKLKRFSC